MRFLLSIHDVWPGNYLLVAEYMERLRLLGASRFALLVVPFYHGRQKIEAAEDFLTWMEQEVSAGTEIFLHGYFHKISERIEGEKLECGRSAWGRWINCKWVNEEAEFYGLADSDQIHLLDRGVAAFKKCQLPCMGFVAPTWYGSPSEASLHNHKIPILESRFFIKNLVSHARIFAPPLAWNQPKDASPKLMGGMVWVETLLRLPLIKVALHPGDFEATETEIVLKRVLKSGHNVAYQDLFKG